MTEASGFGVLLLRVLGSITARFGGYRTIGKDRMTNLSVYGIASLFKVFTNPNPWYEALAVNLAVGKHIGTYPKKKSTIKGTEQVLHDHRTTFIRDKTSQRPVTLFLSSFEKNLVRPFSTIFKDYGLVVIMLLDNICGLDFLLNFAAFFVNVLRCMILRRLLFQSTIPTFASRQCSCADMRTHKVMG